MKFMVLHCFYCMVLYYNALPGIDCSALSVFYRIALRCIELYVLSAWRTL